jgi:hypothetical protein
MTWFGGGLPDRREGENDQNSESVAHRPPESP